MNLIICFTPLQILIVQRIIQEHPNEQFYSIVFSLNNTPKTLAYGKDLSLVSTRYKEIKWNEKLNPIIANFDLLKWVAIGLELPKMKKVFTTHLDHFPSQLLFTRQHKAEIITFDDGSVNIAFNHQADNKTSPLRNKDIKGRFYKLICKLFSVPTPEELLERHSKHYSIYKRPNTMGPSEYISLFPKVKQEVAPDYYTEEVSIFLGQPIYEQGNNPHVENIAMTEHIVRDLKISHYYPHPREDYRVTGVEYIESPLVVEHYILDQLEKYPHRKYKLYSYCSTAMINLMDTGAPVELISVRPKASPEFLDSTYDVIKSLDIPVIELPYSVDELLKNAEIEG